LKYNIDTEKSVKNFRRKIIDIDECEQLYVALYKEQGYSPSRIVPVLVEYYKISEEQAWDFSKNYHAKQATLENNSNE
jgi:hypothetical protein